MPEQDREIHDGTLTIRVRAEDDFCVIAVGGELDLANSATLEDELLGALGDRAGKVVLDMSGLEFIDSTGIAVLVRALGHEKANGRFTVVPTNSAAVARILKLTGVDKQLPLAAAESS